MSIKLKVTIFLSILFATVLGNTICTFLLENYTLERTKWIDHTHEVIILSERYLGSLQDAETGQRGYLLTKKLNYLEPYHTSLKESTVLFDELYAKTSDNPAQTTRLNIIKKLMDNKFAELAQTIKLTQQDDYAASLKLVESGVGKKVMDEIRVELKEFIYTEKLLLQQRKGDFQANRSQIVTLIVVAITFFVMMAIFTFMFLSKTLFVPMELLLKNTQRMDDGLKIDIRDITSQDEMGYLLSSFYKMNEKVTEREESLSYTANHDELTGLANRVKLFEVLGDSIKTAHNNKSKVAVLFLDLDKFKVVNDTLGHEAGDVLLMEASSRFTNAVRSDDKVFRIGGDEFLILLNDIQETSDVEHVMNNILDTIKIPVLHKGEVIKLSVSIGIAIFPEDATTPDELIRAADIAMYTAKQEADVNYKFFDTGLLKRSTD